MTQTNLSFAQRGRRFLRAQMVHMPGVVCRILIRRRTRHAYRHGDREYALLPILVDSSLASLDVGANEGTYSWSLAPLCRKVYAVEPNPTLARLLRKSFDGNVEVLECGLSNEESTLTLWIPTVAGLDLPGRSSVHRDAIKEFEVRSIEVPVRTIDSLGLDDLGFIKVQAEGHEFAVLQGGRQTIERSKPTIVVGAQVRFSPDDPDRIHGLFAGLGYLGYFLHRGRVRPFAEFDARVHQRPDKQLKLGQKGYDPDFVYKFIYVHSERAAVLERLGRWRETPTAGATSEGSTAAAPAA